MSDPLATATGAEGTSVSLYDDRVEIAAGEDVQTIPLADLDGVQFHEPGFLGAGAIQFEQAGVDLPEGGLLRPPRGENTVRFPAVKTPEFRAFWNEVAATLEAAGAER